MAGRECYHCRQWIEEGEAHDSRKSCYFFVRPKRNFLEVCVFLGRALKAPHVRGVVQASKSKLVHIIQIRHRDEVEPPVTDWLLEAYELSDTLAGKVERRRVKSKPKPRPKKKQQAIGARFALTLIAVLLRTHPTSLSLLSGAWGGAPPDANRRQAKDGGARRSIRV